MALPTQALLAMSHTSQVDSVFNPSVQHGKLDYKLVGALERLYHVMRLQLWEAAATLAPDLKLSPIQLQILVWLRFHPPCRVGDLGNAFSVTPATISDAIRVLVTKGLVSKRRAAHDGRVFEVHLTHAGERVASDVAGWANSFATDMAVLNEEEKNTMLSALLKLIGHLQQSGKISVARTCTTCRFFDRAHADTQTAYCNLLKKPLPPVDWRVDCEEHEAAN